MAVIRWLSQVQMRLPGEQIKWEEDYGYRPGVSAQHLIANIKGLVEEEELMEESKKEMPQEEDTKRKKL